MFVLWLRVRSSLEGILSAPGALHGDSILRGSGHSCVSLWPGEGGYCLLAGFLIPKRRWSRFTLSQFVESWRRSGSVLQAMEQLSRCFESTDIHLVVSTSYRYLAFTTQVLRLNPHYLCIAPPLSSSTVSLFEKLKELAEGFLLDSSLLWQPAMQIIRGPPISAGSKKI